MKIPVKTAGKWEGGGGRDYREEPPAKCWENIFNNLDEIKEKSTGEKHQKNFKNIFKRIGDGEKCCQTLETVYVLPLSCAKTCDDQFDKESQQTFGQNLPFFVSERPLFICTLCPTAPRYKGEL